MGKKDDFLLADEMMKSLKDKKFITLIVFLILILVLFCHFHKRNIYIWAWERPEDFSFLKNSKDNITVVYYAGGIVIKNGKLNITKRLNNLLVPDNIKTIPVIRIDNFSGAEALTDDKVIQIKDFIVSFCSKNTNGCQIDFDATSSEREVYKKLLSAVKSKISATPLSITALVSWCDKFSWLNKTDIDFAVPMFYRLGRDEEKINNGYTGQTFMKSPKCDSAIGISLDEPLKNKRYIQGRDIWLFNPNSWNEQSYSKMVKNY